MNHPGLSIPRLVNSGPPSPCIFQLSYDLFRSSFRDFERVPATSPLAE